MRTAAPRQDLTFLMIPAAFVLLWSSGFIVAKIGLGHADTLTFLGLRYGVVTLLMAGVAFAMRAPWPKSWREVGHIVVAGAMLQALYFSSVWLAMGLGVGAGVAALIVCMQPILTAAVVGPLLGERVTRRQWLGLILGFAGVGLVVARKLALGLGSIEGMAWAFVGLVAITFGTIYQKKYCAEMDSRSGSAIQFLVAAVLISPLALIFEDGDIHWTPAFVAALAYIAVFLSLVSMILLTIMIRRGAVSRMTSMFFLVPPIATLLGYLILDEPVGVMALAGMAVAVIGVALVVAPERAN
ncbi:MAG: DMT family transporter [Rhodospirillaceae bacterium]|nr:DMT family transporter [Rhodospirillaceae bacterium]MBT6884281.1 DMT family transporter [Rhodospirillaceae bacterium]